MRTEAQENEIRPIPGTGTRCVLASPLFLFFFLAPFGLVANEVDFATEIRSIFVQHCYNCHGPDDREGGLRLSDQEMAMALLPSGRTAIVPGDPAHSELLRRVSSDDPEERMPPRGGGLTEREVDLLNRWIETGAEWDDTHWAFSELRDPGPPEVADTGWPRQTLDRFVLATLEAADIAPNPEADRPTLVRRIHLDLLGLPPTPEEVAAFVEDDSPDAWTRLVDRLLDSPHFGERWGRHWLDMARFADSDGYLNDGERADAWRYRDWVIDAINRDLPFDEFTTLQLAGDLLENAGPEEVIATAFHRQTLSNKEAGVDEELYRIEAVFDRVETTSQVWLGLTANCARCHDHKYDAFSQKDYFQLYATFDNAEESTARIPGTPEQEKQYAAAKAKHDEKVAALVERRKERETELEGTLASWSADLKKQGATDGGHRIEAPDSLDVYAGGGVTFTELDDRSYLAGGTVPDQVKYTVDFHVDRKDVVGFKVEALPHPDLPAGGPGRAEDGTFRVTEIRAFAKDGPEVSGGARLAFSGSSGDDSAAEHSPANALDGNRRGSGWGISAGQAGKRFEATFLLEEPLPVDETTAVRFIIDQQFPEDGTTLGRFRFSLVTSGAAGLPEPVREALSAAPEEWDEKERELLLAYRLENDDESRELAKAIERLAEEAPKSPALAARVMKERDEPQQSYIMERGEYERRGENVEPGAIAVLHDLKPSGERADRLDLAHWLMAEENGLTRRVAVNHLWLRLFGEGIVRSPDDFGVRGDPPTHPHLLDWLATRYRELGWSRKAMIRMIVDSATYRMASDHRPELYTVDPLNRLLHRQNRFRVEAEIVRDMSLAVAGLLHPEVGGRSVFPPMQEDPTRARRYRWDTETDEQRYRRGLYTFFKRTAPYPTLITFDCPDSSLSVVQRPRSNTPIQALTMLNNEVFVESAQAMGRRMLEAGADDEERLVSGFAAALSRPPGGGELKDLATLLEDGRRWYRDHPGEAGEMIDGPGPDGKPVETPADPAARAELAAYTLVASTLLNLDEFLVRQ